MILETLGAFYHCYRDPEATRHVLRHFRRHYPVATVHLISDGGADFTEMAAEFGCVYFHERNIGLQIRTGKETMHEWIRRVLRVCEQCPEDWILTLEDDVLVRGKLHVPQYQIAGPRQGWQLYNGRPIWPYIQSRHPELVNNGYGGGGGSMFNRRTAVACIRHYLDNEDFDEWRRMTGYVASDIWLTTMFMVCGYQFGPGEDLAECIRDLDWRTSGRAVVHQPPREVLTGE